MGQGFSVNARKLAAGSQDVTGLLGRCEAIAADAVQAIAGMGCLLTEILTGACS